MKKTTAPAEASRRRPSLSRLFLKQTSAAEKEHIRHLQQLSAEHQGKAFAVDDGDLRMMYLNEQCMQSAMRISAPAELLCAYSRVMMSSLLLTPEPQEICIIGFGGGSIAKYVRHHLPACKTRALEIREDVIALREQFAVPPDDLYLRVIHADAADYIPTCNEPVDLLFLDAYDKNGLVAALNTPDFYAHCHRLLKPGGTLVANVWGKPSALAPMLTSLQQLFDGQTGFCRSPDSYNLLVFATKGSISATLLDERMDMLQTQYSTLSFSLCRQAIENGQAIQGQDAILQYLRSVLVEDGKVPQDYAEWKSQVSTVSTVLTVLTQE